MKPYLILYDISNNKDRNRIAREIIKRGLYRLQKSVFFGATTPRAITELTHLFETHLSRSQSPADSYIIIPLTQYNINGLQIFLPQDTEFDLEWYLGEKVIIFI